MTLELDPATADKIRAGWDIGVSSQPVALHRSDADGKWYSGGLESLWADDLDEAIKRSRLLPDLNFRDIHQNQWLIPEAAEDTPQSYSEYLAGLPDYRKDVEGFIRDNFLDKDSPPIRIGNITVLKSDLPIHLGDVNKMEGSRSYPNCKTEFFLRGPCSPETGEDLPPKPTESLVIDDLYGDNPTVRSVPIVDQPNQPEYDDNESVDPKLTQWFDDNYGKPGTGYTGEIP